MSVFIRALRRTDLSLIYTKGFTPRINLSFGPPLQLGIESYVELVDLKLSKDTLEKDILDKLNKELPKDLAILNVKKIDAKTSSIQSTIESITYTVTGFNKTLEINSNWKEIIILKKQNKKTLQIPLEKFLSVMENKNNLLIFKTIFFNESSVKPKDAFFYLTNKCLEDFNTTKESVSYKNS